VLCEPSSYRNAGILAIAARTCAADQIPPRGAEIPRPFNSFAIERSEFAPAVRMSSMTGARSAARDFAASDLAQDGLLAAVVERIRQQHFFGILGLKESEAWKICLRQPRFT
jgi:hypothetical protein